MNFDNINSDYIFISIIGLIFLGYFIVFRKPIIDTSSKVLRDSLTNIDGQYSSKKLTSFVSFGLCVFVFLYLLIMLGNFYEAGFWGFMAMAGFQSTLSTVSNKIPDSPSPDQPQSTKEIKTETKITEINKSSE